MVGGDPASEEKPKLNLEDTLAMLRTALFDFETKFDEKNQVNCGRLSLICRLN